MPTQHTYTRLAAAIVAAAVIISARILAASYFGIATTATRTTTFTVTTTLAPPCSGQQVSGSSNNVPVLLMRPNSTAHICVTYQSAWQGNSSEYQNQYSGLRTYQFSFSISKEQCVTSGGATSCTANISHSFIISAVPGSIQLSGTTNYVTVVYTVTSLSNSTGFYDNSAPYLASCLSIPMAVGYAASQVNASGFRSQNHTSLSYPSVLALVVDCQRDERNIRSVPVATAQITTRTRTGQVVSDIMHYSSERPYLVNSEPARLLQPCRRRCLQDELC